MPRGPPIYSYVIALLLLFLFAHLFHEPQTPIEGFQEQSKIVIALLCVCPNERVIEFAKNYAITHPTYIICDDPECETPSLDNITFVKITDDECRRTGYNNSNPAISKRPSAWDKVILYFCEKNTQPDHVWFIEEDVFVPRADIFKELDQRYPTTDLVTKQHVKDSEDPSFEFWYDGDGKMERPFYRSLVCCTRVSRQLFQKVKELHDEKNTLCFIEIIFSTLAVQNNFSIEKPNELQSIIFRHTWTEDTVNADALFHPIKDTTLHDIYRERLASETE
jgi:hypothetical protein